jgi:hypothetical protein
VNVKKIGKKFRILLFLNVKIKMLYFSRVVVNNLKATESNKLKNNSTKA